MNKPQPGPHGDYPTPASAGVLFARTHDDLLVAKVGDHAFGMMPDANGRYYLASAIGVRHHAKPWSPTLATRRPSWVRATKPPPRQGWGRRHVARAEAVHAALPSAVSDLLSAETSSITASE